jgi:arabinofuranosyltransferase
MFTISKKITKLFHSADLIWLILLVAVFGIILFQMLPGPRPLDDAYITYRYARNVSTGAGFIYNPGERVQGTTTPLYTLLLAGLAILFHSVSIPTISFAISLIADLINTLLVFRIAKYFLKHNVAAFILAIVFLLQPLRINVAQGGMETSLFLTLLLAMYDCYFIGNNIYLAAFFGALAILTRVDAVLAVAPVFIHALWKQPGKAIKAGLFGAILLVPWFVWATWYFGSPIPESILAKITSYNYSSLQTLYFLFTFLSTGTIGPYRDFLIIVPGLIISLSLIFLGVRWLRAGNADALVVVAYPVLYYILMTVQHAPVFFSWYYLPLMPGFLLIFFGGILYLFRTPPLLGNARLQGILLSLFALILIGVPATLLHVLPGWADNRVIETTFRETSNSIQDEIQPGQVVMAYDIGVVGWDLSNSRILDPIGLVSPVSLKYYVEKGTLNIIKMVEELKPDYVFCREIFITKLLNNPKFLADYRLIQQRSIPFPNNDRVLVFKKN